MLENQMMDEYIIEDLCNENIQYLQQGANIIKNVPETVFYSKNHALYKSNIELQLHHIIDYYTAFFRGVYQPNGQVDYDFNESLYPRENIPAELLLKIEETIQQLNDFKTQNNRSILVKKSINFKLLSNKNNSPLVLPSTVMRELYSIMHHTLHHFYIIMMILKLHNIELDENFQIITGYKKYKSKTDLNIT